MNCTSLGYYNMYSNNSCEICMKDCILCTSSSCLICSDENRIPNKIVSAHEMNPKLCKCKDTFFEKDNNCIKCDKNCTNCMNRGDFCTSCMESDKNLFLIKN